MNRQRTNRLLLFTRLFTRCNWMLDFALPTEANSFKGTFHVNWNINSIALHAIVVLYSVKMVLLLIMDLTLMKPLIWSRWFIATQFLLFDIKRQNSWNCCSPLEWMQRNNGPMIHKIVKNPWIDYKCFDG